MTLLSDAWSMQVSLLKQEGTGERDGDDNTITTANDEGDGEEGADGDQDGERDGEDNATTAANNEGNGEDGADIKGRKRMALEIIVADTGVNRPQRTRGHTDINQAGTKMTVKRPGRGRGMR